MGERKKKNERKEKNVPTSGGQYVKLYIIMYRPPEIGTSS
jgi:hypothetical protein